jgi:hypothetical protein
MAEADAFGRFPSISIIGPESSGGVGQITSFSPQRGQGRMRPISLIEARILASQVGQPTKRTFIVLSIFFRSARHPIAPGNCDFRESDFQAGEADCRRHGRNGLFRQHKHRSRFEGMHQWSSRKPGFLRHGAAQKWQHVRRASSFYIAMVVTVRRHADCSCSAAALGRFCPCSIK